MAEGTAPALLERDEYEGRVLWFDRRGSYGFLHCARFGFDFFFRASDVQRLAGGVLVEGDIVAFQIGQRLRGAKTGRAVELRVLRSARAASEPR